MSVKVTLLGYLNDQSPDDIIDGFLGGSDQDIIYGLRLLTILHEIVNVDVYQDDILDNSDHTNQNINLLGLSLTSYLANAVAVQDSIVNSTQDENEQKYFKVGFTFTE